MIILRLFLNDTETDFDGFINRLDGSIVFNINENKYKLKLSYQDCMDVIGMGLKAESNVRKAVE